MTELDVRGGRLLEVGDQAHSAAGIKFLPAVVKLDGTSFSPEFPLSEHAVRLEWAPDVRDLVEQGLDAIWVRSRIKALFGVDAPPESQRIEKSLMTFGFAAIPDMLEGGRARLFPFECTDYYGRSSLFFAEDEPPPGIREAIASAFWQLLLADQEDVADYQDRAYHIGAGFWMHYGRRNGAFFYDEKEDE